MNEYKSYALALFFLFSSLALIAQDQCSTIQNTSVSFPNSSQIDVGYTGTTEGGDNYSITVSAIGETYTQTATGAPGNAIFNFNGTFSSGDSVTISIAAQCTSEEVGVYFGIPTTIVVDYLLGPIETIETVYGAASESDLCDNQGCGQFHYADETISLATFCDYIRRNDVDDLTVAQVIVNNLLNMREDVSSVEGIRLELVDCELGGKGKTDLINTHGNCNWKINITNGSIVFSECQLQANSVNLRVFALDGRELYSQSLNSSPVKLPRHIDQQLLIIRLTNERGELLAIEKVLFF